MTFTSVNPHDPADVLGEWQPAGPAGAEAAVGRAVTAAAGWRASSGRGPREGAVRCGGGPGAAVG